MAPIHPAWGQEPVSAPASSPEVAERANAASAAFEAGDYEVAVTEFEAAYALNGDPSFLFNIGRVHEEAGQLEKALSHYERFVVEPGVSLEHRKLAHERILVLGPIVNSARDKASDEESPGDLEARSPEPTPSPSPGDTGNDPPRGQRLVITGAVLTGLGAASLIVGGVFAGLSARDVDRVDSAPTPERRDELESSAVRNATIGDAMLISGGVVTAAGLGILVTGLVLRKRGRQTAAVHVSPTLGGAVVSGRF